MTSGSKTAASKRLGTLYDAQLLLPVLFLVGIGIVMVYSASSALALKKYGSDYYFLKRQAIFALLGILAMITARHVPYEWYRPMTYPLLLTALALLILVQVSNAGITAGGARRWLRLGTLTFQPVEVTRLALVVYLAYSMQKKSERLQQFLVGFFPHVVILGLFSTLIFMQPDFGSVVILSAIVWVMMFVGGVPLIHLLSPLLLIVPLGLMLMAKAEYRIHRLISFWDPWQYADGAGYQTIHSLMAFGTGGWWGVGIGKGYQKLFYLPEPHTDFIFSVIGEELGLVGILLIVSLYAVIVWRGFGIARLVGDEFGTYMAVGLTTTIALQVTVNMGVALGLLPTKGLTLPFLSYGGTSLLLSMVSIGILMNIASKSGRFRKKR